MAFWNRKSKKQGADLPWDKQATQALEQAINQAPVPKMMKNQVKKQLAGAAQEAAANAGHERVTAEDLMEGLKSKLPDHMKKQVEDAQKQGPEGLQNLQKKLKKKK